MEKLKNENLKKIEIKIVGDNCIVSYPSSKLPSLNEVPSFPKIDNDLRATIDLNLSLSSNSEEDFISNLKEIKKKKKDNESNSKKKLEITNKSIFYSESNLKLSSSDRNIKKNSKNEGCYVKNYVIKKLNFDLYETKEVVDKNKKLSESDRIQKKNSFLYNNKNAINNNLLINNTNQIYETKKRRNSMFNNELINFKKEETNKAKFNKNQSFIRHKPNNSFVLQNPFNNNKHIYLNNSNIKNKIHDKGNITLNKKQSTPKNKNKFNSPNIYSNNKINIKNKIQEKSLAYKNLKFKSNGNFTLSNLNNNNKKVLSKKNEGKTNNKINNSKIKENKNIKFFNKNIQKLIKTNNINKKNMYCIKKSNKKEVPNLISTITNSNNLKNEKRAIFIKNNEYCSLKQYYHLKSPSLLNIPGSSTTPMTSTNGCTNYTNCTNSSTLNSPSNNTTKIIIKSNLDGKNTLKKYHSQNTFLKNCILGDNTLNYNNNIIKIKNFNLGKLQNKNFKNNNNNLYKYTNKTFKNNLNINNSYKKASKHRTINPLKNSNINRKILNKCNTNELKNILKSNVKSLHKILAERNINGVYTNNSIIHNRDNTFDINSNLNNNNEMFSNHLKYNNLNI